MITVSSVTFSSTVQTTVETEPLEPVSAIMVAIYDTEVAAAPTSLTASLAGGLADTAITFKIDGITVYEAVTDSTGGLEPTSIPVPDLRDAGGNTLMTPGEHVLSVHQGLVIGEATFTILRSPPSNPRTPELDADPVDIAAATLPNGARRWILQDLMPGGLGSWVMPMNPKDMSSPPFQRSLSTRRTTAPDGQFHIYEGARQPAEWTFEGYCPTEEMRNQLEAYGDLRRRFYVIDHRARAWVVTFVNVDLRPRLMQIWNGDWTDQGHDYTVTAIVYDQNFVEV